VVSLYLQCSPYERALRYLEREVSPEAGAEAELELPKHPYTSLQAVATEMAHLDIQGIKAVTATFLGNANRDEDDASRYKALYGFDYREGALYDKVINVDERSREANFGKVVASLQGRGGGAWFGS
jgi:hypothetical protein